MEGSIRHALLPPKTYRTYQHMQNDKNLPIMSKLPIKKEKFWNETVKSFKKMLNKQKWNSIRKINKLCSIQIIYYIWFSEKKKKCAEDGKKKFFFEIVFKTQTPEPGTHCRIYGPKSNQKTFFHFLMEEYSNWSNFNK